MRLAAVFVFALIICTALAELGGKRALVLLEDSSIEGSHSKFFRSLRDRGYQLTFQDVSADSNIHLHKYGHYEYDHAILFAPSAEIETEDFLEFVDNGGNVLVAASSSVSDSIRDFASECGIDLDEEGTAVIDHVNYDASDYDSRHTLIISELESGASLILGDKKMDPVLFRGVGAKVRDHALNYPLIKASSSSYVSKITGSATSRKAKAGKPSSLVAALQARNHARVVVSGSLDLFSDKLFVSTVKKYNADKVVTVSEKTGNEQLSNIITRWVFQEKGSLRSRDLTHNIVGATGPRPEMYTVTDTIDFSVIIEEWNGEKWVPYQADDVQLEIQMLDPYIRTTLKHDTNGKFFATVKLPDVYGVFTFKIDYQRPGYGGLYTFDRIPIRPFRHNQYERFIDSAYPYYAGAFSMLVGLVLFSAVFLYHSEKPTKSH